MEAELKAVPGISRVISYNSLIGSGIPEFFLPERYGKYSAPTTISSS